MKFLSVKTVLLLFVFLYSALCLFYWSETRNYAQNESFKKIQNLLFMHKAIHGYVEELQKPAIYELKESGRLYKEYFSPQILSFTFIARNIKDYYNKERVKAAQSPIYFKLASSNPRNEINKASADEEALIQRFNAKKTKEYKSVIEENGSKFLYYALPVQPNQTSCMRCHGTPDKAPKELIELRGDKAGFYEELGKIRAIISIKAPLDGELHDANRIFMLLSFATFIAFSAIYFVIAYFLSKLEKINQTLSEQVEMEVQKRVEGERILIQQGKMAAMGEMIGAIAHQWKQPLNALSVLSQDVKSAYEYEELNGEYIDQFNKKANEQIRYMAKTIDDFKNFFKPDKEKKKFCINEAVQNGVSLLQTQMKNSAIELDMELVSPSVIAFGNKNEFLQAFINILNNAKDALIEKRLSDKEFLARIVIKASATNNKITIIVEDNGGGIDESLKDRIFEPYITSKAQGTGIGLYMSALIIKEGFGGVLSADNGANGARFTIEIDEFIES